MLKYFATNRGNCYTSVIIEVSLVTMVVFHNWNNSATLKLSRDVAVHQHSVEEASEPIKQRERPMKEMFGLNSGVISRFAFLQAENRIYDVF